MTNDNLQKSVAREPKIIIIRLCVSANKNLVGGGGVGVVVVACVKMEPVPPCTMLFNSVSA
jgi:hypothetical protein